MIRLLPFQLTSLKYFQILLYNRFRRFWWMYLLMIIVALLYIPRMSESSTYSFIVLFPFIYVVAIILWLYIYAKSKKNKNLFDEVNYSFDNEQLFIETKSSSSNIDFTSIIEYKNRKEYFMLYMSKGQFLYVPKAAFIEKKDREKFLDLIIHAIH